MRGHVGGALWSMYVGKTARTIVANDLREDMSIKFVPGDQVRPVSGTAKDRNGAVFSIPLDARMTVVRLLPDGWVLVGEVQDPKCFPWASGAGELHSDDIVLVEATG